MAESKGIDVLMKVVITAKSLAMEAENQTELEPVDQGDSMLDDFKSGYFCELREFDFSAGVESLIKKDKQTGPTPPPEPDDDIQTSVARSQWKRSLSRRKGEFVDMQPVGYTRIMDSSSPLLFKALADCTTVASITIVKRKGAGATTAGRGYLRLDFEEVLMTKLDWKDSEHVMLENGTFIYRKLTIKYLSQKPDGTLVPGSSANWLMKATRTGS
jgi:type VI protein secretion system component Hcp